MKDVPIYRYPWSYARENGHEEAYRLSLKANIACKNAIETAIATHTSTSATLRGVNFDAAKAVAEVVPQFGLERTVYVIANTLRLKNWDARYSSSNKSWAATIPSFHCGPGIDDVSCRFCVDKAHAVLIDAFAEKVRKLHEGSCALKK